MTPGAAFWSGFFRGLSGIAQRTSARSDRRQRRRVVQRQDGVDELVHTLFANPWWLTVRGSCKATFNPFVEAGR